MKLLMVPATVAVVLIGGARLAPADAAGCLKGAAVGAVAGHFAGHHALLGAGAGCVIGHEAANRRMAEHDRAYEPPPGYSPQVEGYQPYQRP